MAYSTHDIINLQKTIAPSVYGELDLTLAPERFRYELGEKSIVRDNPHIQALLADKEKVEFFRQLTLMGDPLADAYASLIPQIGFKKARAMLDQAVAHGVDSVTDAPPELVALMRSVETVPDWVDWDKIEYAARRVRPFTALAGEAIIRVSFMMTYVNGYQGLPMIITGALTSDSAAKRMKETISTFKMAALPGALRKGGVAYQSALKVRLMHAMVRCNLLKRPQTWDYSVYGVPIPQVDQMGAALGPTQILARYALKHGGKFNRDMAAFVEQTRYLAYLLGMHDQFLSNDPQQIVDTWSMCQATLRHKFDPRGKMLNEATVNAYRRHSESRFDRLMHYLDVRSTKFLYTQMVGEKTARTMGVMPEKTDVLSFAALFLPIGLGYAGLSAASLVPKGRKWVDRFAVKEIRRQLSLEGEAEYATDASNYKDGTAAR